MNHPRATYAVLGLIVLALFFLAWRMWTYDPERAAAPETLSADALPLSPADPSALSLYSSGEYGIAFAYPSTATLIATADDDLVAAEPVRDALRAETLVAELAQGAVRVRIRARTAQPDACFAVAPAERPEDPREIGAQTWRVVARTALGTEHERRITEFRTVDGSRCVTVEESRPADGTPESPLAATVLGSLEIAPAMSAPE